MLKTKRMKESDIFFVQFAEGQVARTIQRKPDIFIDLDRKNRPLSLEIVGMDSTPARQIQKVIREFGLSTQLKTLLRFARATGSIHPSRMSA